MNIDTVSFDPIKGFNSLNFQRKEFVPQSSNFLFDESFSSLSNSVDSVPKKAFDDESNPLFDSIRKIIGGGDGNEGSEVLVIDDFSNKEIDIDGDGKNDLTHGDTVTRYISQNGKDVESFDVSGKDGYLDDKKIHDKLGELVENPGDTKVVNLSLGAEISLEELSEITGVEITAENFASEKDNIKAAIKNDPELAREHGTKLEIVDYIEQLSAKGIQINIAAGNGGDGTVNFLSLAEGENVNIVGATDQNGDEANYSSDGATVYRQGTYDINETADGYDINGDGVTDVTDEEVSTKGAGDGNTIGGTSFAAPAFSYEFVA